MKSTFKLVRVWFSPQQISQTQTQSFARQPYLHICVSEVICVFSGNQLKGHGAVGSNVTRRSQGPTISDQVRTLRVGSRISRRKTFPKSAPPVSHRGLKFDICCCDNSSDNNAELHSLDAPSPWELFALDLLSKPRLLTVKSSVLIELFNEGFSPSFNLTYVLRRFSRIILPLMKLARGREFKV